MRVGQSLKGVTPSGFEDGKSERARERKGGGGGADRQTGRQEKTNKG